jgi:methionyl-tRNA formyltransferase
LRVTFFGTSEFAVPTLRRIMTDGHEVTSVVTQPARPSGRGRRPEPSPIEAAARAVGLSAMTPEDPNEPGFLASLHGQKPDVGVLVAYGCILADDLLEVPARGFINVHPSLLPKYRGAAPIQRALLHGDARTGVSIVKMRAAIDAGEIIAQESTSVGPDETAGELSARLALSGAELIAGVLGRSSFDGTPQDGTAVTKAPKITKADRAVAWTEAATNIHNRIRALSPEPGAVAGFRGDRVVLLRSRLVEGESGVPGTIRTEQAGLVVAAQNGAVELLLVKPEGKNPQTGADFRNGRRVVPGERMENG